jgi:ribosomal protein S6E (S10)
MDEMANTAVRTSEPRTGTALQCEIDRADALVGTALRIRNQVQGINERLTGLSTEDTGKEARDANGNLPRLGLMHDRLEVALHEIEMEVTRLQELV